MKQWVWDIEKEQKKKTLESAIFSLHLYEVKQYKEIRRKDIALLFSCNAGLTDSKAFTTLVVRVTICQHTSSCYPFTRSKTE